MGEPSAHKPEPPPLLEQLGALGSLLIHDMANQMCIISGNATFAQMMLQDPQQLSRAVDAIVKSSERMSFILGQCAELRRRLGGEMPKCQAPTAVEAVKTLLAERPGWTLEIAEGLQGELAMPLPWVSFGLEQTLREIGAKTGRLRLRRARPDSETTFLPGGAYLEIRLWWESPQPLSIDQLRTRFENFSLLAVFELTRQCGGKLEGFTAAPGRQEVLYCVPFAYEIGSRSA
jgi:hypothetical protein